MGFQFQEATFTQRCCALLRYLHLAWATWEKQNGNTNNARKLLERGQRLTPRDAAILQVKMLPCSGILEACRNTKALAGRRNRGVLGSA